MRPSGMVLGLLAAVTLVAAPSAGRAQDLAGDDGPAPRPNVVRLDVGVASAIGFLGLTYTRAVGELAQVEAGVGLGYSGTQLSLMPKIVLGSPEVHFVTGAGISVAIPTNPLHATGYPVWLNVDAVGLELVSRRGITALITAGFTRGLGGGGVCTNVFDGCEPGEKLSSAAGLWGPQVRAGWGFAF